MTASGTPNTLSAATTAKACLSCGRCAVANRRGCAGRDSGIRRIAVIGATGMLGLPVVRALVEAGFEVTALVRNPDKARTMLPDGVRIVPADVADSRSLELGFAGQDAVYLSLSIAPDAKQGDFHAEGEGLANILAAAQTAGIKRIGYLSALIQDAAGSGWWVLDIWKKAIADIKGSGVPYTIFYPTNFMETLPQRHVLGGVLALIGRPRHANYWIAGSDYGMQVARAFRIAEAANRDYIVQGPEPLTYSEAGRRFARTANGRLCVMTVPLILLSWLGLFSRSMRFSAQVMKTVLRYPETFAAGDTWRDLGRPKTTIEAFARQTATTRAAG